MFGRSGWIGGLVGEILKAEGKTFEFASAKLEDRSSIQAELDRVNISEPICHTLILKDFQIIYITSYNVQLSRMLCTERYIAINSGCQPNVVMGTLHVVCW